LIEKSSFLEGKPPANRCQGFTNFPETLDEVYVGPTF